MCAYLITVAVVFNTRSFKIQNSPKDEIDKILQNFKWYNNWVFIGQNSDIQIGHLCICLEDKSTIYRVLDNKQLNKTSSPQNAKGKDDRHALVINVRQWLNKISSSPQNGNGKSKDDRHALVINVSPMEYGHCLLLPQVDRCLPQVKLCFSHLIVMF